MFLWRWFIFDVRRARCTDLFEKWNISCIRGMQVSIVRHRRPFYVYTPLINSISARRSGFSCSHWFPRLCCSQRNAQGMSSRGCHVESDAAKCVRPARGMTVPSALTPNYRRPRHKCPLIWTRVNCKQIYCMLNRKLSGPAHRSTQTEQSFLLLSTSILNISSMPHYCRKTLISRFRFEAPESLKVFVNQISKGQKKKKRGRSFILYSVSSAFNFNEILTYNLIITISKVKS